MTTGIQHRWRCTRRRVMFCLLPAASAVALIAGPANAAPVPLGRDSVVYIAPPHAAPRGLTYAEWGARFWQWSLSYPLKHSPEIAQGRIDCGRGQLGNVWMLPGTVYPVTHRSCDVPARTALVLPIAGGECSTLEAPPFHGDNYRDLRACIAKFQFTQLSAVIDGHPVPRVQRFLTYTPEFRWVAPRGLLPGVKPGSIGHSVGRQALLFIELPAGQHHLRTHETIVGIGTIDVSYLINVRQGTA